MLHWEDFRVGDVTELGTVDVTEEDVIAFATRFDPQPFHVDPEAAKQSLFGGLIASGWHTTALFMSLFVRGFLLDSASLGSPGVEAIRWTAPVRPGDTLTGRVTVTASQPSATNPSRGTVTTASEVFNQRGELVMTLSARGHFARRTPAESSSSGVESGSGPV
jgi:acyl dehydratase